MRPDACIACATVLLMFGVPLIIGCILLFAMSAQGYHLRMTIAIALSVPALEIRDILCIIQIPRQLS